MTLSNAPGALETIKVTADAHTSWSIEFVQAINQPTLAPLGPQWTQITSFSTTSSVTAQEINAGQSTAYKTLELVMLCFGEINLPVCDGQPHLSTVSYPFATTLIAVDVMVTGNILWDAEIFGCSNEQPCTA